MKVVELFDINDEPKQLLTATPATMTDPGCCGKCLVLTSLTIYGGLFVLPQHLWRDDVKLMNPRTGIIFGKVVTGGSRVKYSETSSPLFHSCEIECFVDTHLCKLCLSLQALSVILRSRILRGGRPR